MSAILSSTSEKLSYSLALNALSAFSKNNIIDNTQAVASVQLVTELPVLPLKRVLSSNNFDQILEDNQISVTISSHMSSTDVSDSDDSDVDSFTNKSIYQPKKVSRIDSENQLSSIPYCIPAEALPYNAMKCSLLICKENAINGSSVCSKHIRIKTCSFDGCNKCAQGSTKFCISHGGGRRCKAIGCLKGARDRNFCANHGGGKRCKEIGCNKSAVGSTDLCTSHGGGKKCGHDNCTKSAQSPSFFCARHGGGRKCRVENCIKVARGKTLYCSSHNTSSASSYVSYDRDVEMEKEIVSTLLYLNGEYSSSPHFKSSRV